jgi:protein TonB
MPITLKDDSGVEAQGAPPTPRTDVKQRRRMLVAMAVLLAAVVIVFIKDRQLWFSSSPGPESEVNNQNAAPPPPGPAPSLPSAEVVTPAVVPSTAKKRSAPAAPSSPAASSSTVSAPGGAMITATDRAVLPPLEVEVVAGNRHQPLAASNSSVKVEMQAAPASGTTQAAAPAPSPESHSDAHVSLSQDTTARVTRTVEPSYPLLAKQMKVQGAVVLQALIDRTGNIQDLHVVSGPTILAAAAREAVKQWHFKPYFQAGQAVETEARITVNFTISTY